MNLRNIEIMGFESHKFDNFELKVASFKINTMSHIFSDSSSKSSRPTFKVNGQTNLLVSDDFNPELKQISMKFSYEIVDKRAAKMNFNCKFGFSEDSSISNLPEETKRNYYAASKKVVSRKILSNYRELNLITERKVMKEV